MSDCKVTFLPGAQRPSYGNGVLSCKAGLLSLESLPNAEHAIACIDGCLGIVDPATTVPELVDMCERLICAIDEDDAPLLIDEARAVLAKTGKT